MVFRRARAKLFTYRAAYRIQNIVLVCGRSLYHFFVSSNFNFAQDFRYGVLTIKVRWSRAHAFISEFKASAFSIFLLISHDPKFIIEFVFSIDWWWIIYQSIWVTLRENANLIFRARVHRNSRHKRESAARAAADDGSRSTTRGTVHIAAEQTCMSHQLTQYRLSTSLSSYSRVLNISFILFLNCDEQLVRVLHNTCLFITDHL